MMSAAASEFTTTPVSSSACGVVRPLVRATRATAVTVASAPPNAASGTSGDTGSMPSTSAVAPATAAPPLMPSTWGSASGFASSP